MKGIMIFKQAKMGSKSEGIYPYLYMGKAEFTKVYFKGDNPFENATLWKYDGKKVVLEGELNENKLFVATAVSEDKEEEVVEVVELKTASESEESITIEAQPQQAPVEEEIEGEIV